MILNLFIGLAATLTLAIPGVAVALTWSPRDTDDEGPLWHVALGLGWGFGIVPFIAFCWALFTMDPLTPWVTGASALVVTGCAGWWWWSRQGRRIPNALQQGWREAAPVLLGCAVIGAVYFFKYDRSIFFLESCIHRVVIQTLQLADTTIDILASNQDDQRLGNTSVISSFVVLYRGLGFRVLYAFVGAIIGLGGYLLGRRLLGSTGWAWFVMLALPLNPYVAKIPLLDENLLTLGFLSLTLPLILRSSVPWGHVGAFFGLAVMMRHTGILCLPAILWVLSRNREHRGRAFGWFLFSFSVVTSVAHIHHYVALGSIFRFESFGQIPEFSHRFVGNYSGLLQWPFADHIVRTPWNPFPTFLMWPIYLADHLGLVLFAALLVGPFVMVRAHRAQGIFWLLWFVPLYAALSLQENWDVPNKMGVIYVLFHPLILWAAVGLKKAADNPRIWGVVLSIVALASGFGVRGLQAYQATEDRRYYEAWPGEREEVFDYVAAERDRVTDVAPWPDYGRLGPVNRLFHPSKITRLAEDIANPTISRKGTAYGWFGGETIDLEAPSVVIEIDLRKRPFGNDETWLRKAPAGAVAHVDLTTHKAPAVITNLKVGWSSRPVSVLLTPSGAPVTGATLVFERWGLDKERLAYLHERYHRGLMMVMGWAANDIYRLKSVEVANPVLRLRVPAGPFSLIESVNNAGQNYLFWRTWVEASSALDVQGPRRVFHN